MISKHTMINILLWLLLLIYQHITCYTGVLTHNMQMQYKLVFSRGCIGSDITLAVMKMESKYEQLIYVE